jgi:hypothetical protein
VSLGARLQHWACGGTAEAFRASATTRNLFLKASRITDRALMLTSICSRRNPVPAADVHDVTHARIDAAITLFTCTW